MASPPPPPPMQPGLTPPPQQRPGGLLAQFQGLPWWQIVLALLPLTLILVGGLIGAVIGVLGSIGNLAIARSSMSTAVRALVMIGITVACYVADFVVVILLYSAIRPNG